MNYTRKAAAGLASAAALTAGMMAPADAARPVVVGGLVNVVVTDVIDDVTVTVTDVNVTVPVAANIIANVCGVTIPVAVLATQVLVQDRTFTCEGAGDIDLTVDNA
jgi:hypothetical protein